MWPQLGCVMVPVVVVVVVVPECLETVVVTVAVGWQSSVSKSTWQMEHVAPICERSSSLSLWGGCVGGGGCGLRGGLPW